MIFLAFLLLSLLVALGIRFDQLKENLVPTILIAIYSVSILPSLQIPYIIDDMDHLYQLSISMERSQVTRWLFTPHNEHAIPFLKFLYYIFYKNFWLFPQPFHIVIIAVCTGILCLSYHLILQLTNSKYSAFFCIMLLASTNLPDLAIYVITNSHIIFCLFFLLLLFYCQYRYLTDKKKPWAFLIVLSIALSLATFSLGIASLLFAFLFERLCIPEKLRKTNGSAMLFVFIGWALGLLPYLFSLDKIIYNEQYKFVGASSVVQVMDMWKGLQMFGLYFYHHLIPRLLPDLYLSIGLLFLAVFSGFKYKKYIDWKQIIFFLCAGFSFSFIIYTFRAAWGPLYTSVSRYDVFPSLMLCMVYVILINPFLKDKISLIEHRRYRYVIYFLAFFLVSWSATIRYNRAKRVSMETNVAIQDFNFEFKNATTLYFKDNPHIKNLNLKDPLLYAPNIPSLTTRNGFSPYPSRYPRTISFYAQYVLPVNIKNKITFGTSTDQSFLDYLRNPHQENSYASLISFIE